MVFRQMRRDSVQIEAGERSSGHAHQGTAEFGAIRCREATAPEGALFFYTSCLYQAQVAGHLKLTLGTPANKLAEFVAAFAEFLKKGEAQIPDVLVFRSSSQVLKQTCGSAAFFQATA